MRTIITILLFVVCIAKAPAQSLGIYNIPPFERAVRCIKYFEGWHTAKDYPYIGYGHRIQPGEHFKLPLTRKQADSLLRSDLRKLCRMFRSYGKDSLLLATLAYNVGCGTLIGTMTKPRSILLKKLDRGERNIRSEYLCYCHYKSRFIPSIRKRRIVELKLLYEE